MHHDLIKPALRLLTPLSVAFAFGCADPTGSTVDPLVECGPVLALDEASTGPAVTVSTPIIGAGQFPVVARHGRTVSVVFRGSGGHVDPDGRLDMIRSADGGHSWTSRHPIIDGPLDDRNPALGYNNDGDLLLAYAEVDSYDARGVFIAGPDSRYSSVVTRSRNHGLSWSPPSALNVSPFEWSSPYGKIVNTGRELLLPMYGGWHPIFDDAAKTEDTRGFFAFILRSRDGGRTWSKPEIIGQLYAEPALLPLPGGDVIAALRRLPEDDLVIARWRARTAVWNIECMVTTTGGIPGDFVTLPDGGILLLYGERVESPRGVRARRSSDGGRTWSAPIVVAESEGFDIGYPSSVVVDDEVLTAFYSESASGRALHTVRFRP